MLHGLPGSGLNLLQRIVSLHPHVSSMVAEVTDVQATLTGRRVETRRVDYLDGGRAHRLWPSSLSGRSAEACLSNTTAVNTAGALDKASRTAVKLVCPALERIAAEPAHRQALWSAWAPHWDLRAKVLTQRFSDYLVRPYNAALGMLATHVVLIRHPLCLQSQQGPSKTKNEVLPCGDPASCSAVFVHALGLLHEQLRAIARGNKGARPRVAVVRYEDLVTDPTGVAEAVLAMAGIGFDEFDTSHVVTVRAHAVSKYGHVTEVALPRRRLLRYQHAHPHLAASNRTVVVDGARNIWAAHCAKNHLSCMGNGPCRRALSLLQEAGLSVGYDLMRPTPVADLRAAKHDRKVIWSFVE